VYVDGKMIIDFWDTRKYIYDEDAHHEAIVELSGKHAIRVEQVENTGYATLIFSFTTIITILNFLKKIYEQSYHSICLFHRHGFHQHAE
jgi:hypothetical protein